MMTRPTRVELRNSVLAALQRLRTAFPLEQRLAGVDAGTRDSYAAILRHWLTAAVPQARDFPSAHLAALQRVDAVVHGESGLGCYPFSARPGGIRVALPRGDVAAMCAIDALAIARLAGERAEIHAACLACDTPLRIRVEGDGGLDHDQADRARVAWLAHCDSASTCSDGLCRALRFLCMDCPAPSGSDCYTLPQAAAIGNAFFGFQRVLLQSGPGGAA